MSDAQEKIVHSGEDAPRREPVADAFHGEHRIDAAAFLVLSVAGYALFRDVMGSFQ